MNWAIFSEHLVPTYTHGIRYNKRQPKNQNDVKEVVKMQVNLTIVEVCEQMPKGEIQVTSAPIGAMEVKLTGNYYRPTNRSTEGQTRL